MFSAKDTKGSAALATNGLLISGLSSNASDTSSAPELSASSTATSAWSSENIVLSEAGIIQENEADQHDNQYQDAVSAAAAAIATVASVTQNSSGATGGPSHSGSTESLSRRRNTLAETTPTNRIALELECLENPFSPPSTTYFAFLNRPSRLQRSSHLHPLDIDSVDPLEPPSSSSSRRASLQPQPFDPLPIHHHSSQTTSSNTGSLDTASTYSLHHDEIGLDDVHIVSEDENEYEDDGDGLDVQLVDEGREATSYDVMEQSTAPDFPDAGSNLHSRRSSIQIGSGVGGPSLPPMLVNHGVLLPTAMDFDRLGAISSSSSSSTGGSMGVGGLPPPAAANGTSRFGGRRASMPSNRLEM
ncbi:hypothetical protein FBU30_009687 [Linnemannia zychae]|nr:hypothetical protein FBU30_009687 [Linnemannia zychae]